MDVLHSRNHEILRAATRRFARQGFDGTSLQQIADDVGIRKPSLLYHYASKEKLRLAVLDALLERWNEVLPRLLMAAAGGERRFGAVIQETVHFFTEDSDRAKLLVRETLDRPDDMRERLTEYVSPWLHVVAAYIRQGQQQGDVYEDADPEAYILQVINLVVSGVSAASSIAGALLPEDSPLGTPSERHTRELLRMARCSLFASPPASESAPVRQQDSRPRAAGQGDSP